MIVKPKFITFHDSIKPIINFHWLVGMGIYRYSNTVKNEYIHMQLYTILIILTYWIMTYFGLSEITDPSKFQNTTPAALIMYRILVVTNCCTVATSPFLVWLQKEGLKDCTRQMQILDDTFEIIFGAKKEYKKQYIRLIGQITAIILMMILVGICDSAYIVVDTESLFRSFAFGITIHYPIIIMLVLDLKFCTFVGFVWKKFRDMNNGLRELSEKISAFYRTGDKKIIHVIPRKVPKFTSLEYRMMNSKSETLIKDNNSFLYEIRKSHLELCKLSRKINKVFGIQNLISIGISFVMITGFLYTIYISLTAEDEFSRLIAQVVPSIIWTLIYAFKIWVINYLCWAVSNEADMTGEIIYEIVESRVEKELQIGIQEFGIQMLQNPVRFDACGFFTLNYALLQGVIGSITTYLVILIQMS